jgi:heat shock protein HslJ
MENPDTSARSRASRTLAVMLAVSTLVGCSVMRLRESTSPVGREWVFTHIGGYEDKLPAPPTNASFLLSADSGRVVGSTSCNPLSGSFKIDVTTGKLRFDNIVNGSASCRGTNAKTESAVVGVIKKTDSFRMTGKSLSLLSNGTELARLENP